MFLEVLLDSSAPVHRSLLRSLFYSFVCSSNLCILSYMHVPYGAFFINKEFEFEFTTLELIG
jgi:hypothetical protein